MKKAILTLAVLIAVAAGRGIWVPALAGGGIFPHEPHEGAFESCDDCHAGIVAGDPYGGVSADLCGNCHEGDLLSGWTAPSPVGNWTFDHASHLAAEGVACTDCHRAPGSDMDMAVIVPAEGSCLGCHGEGGVSVHEPGFDLEHRVAAVTQAMECALCHAESSCEQCHDGVVSPGFHGRNFIMRHGAEAHARDTDCAGCHSTEVFCRECHARAGLSPQGGTASSAYHDREPFWLLSHGQAGRQDLETCASCHQQTDCLKCHSAASGWRVSPHGPDFDPTRVSERNLQMCRTCHATDPRP